MNIYKNKKDEIISYLLADYLKNADLCREDETISLWDESKGGYIFGFNVTKEVRDITRNIAPRFVNGNTVSGGTT